MRERLQAREANAALGALTPLESSLVSDIELITAHADPEVQVREEATRVLACPLQRRWRRLGKQLPEAPVRKVRQLSKRL